MSQFKFNFLGDNSVLSEEEKDTEKITWFESEEIVPDGQIKKFDEIVKHAKMFTCGDIEIGHVVVNEVLKNVKDSGIKNTIELAEHEHSDLVAGKYEGGLKIWECTYDLIDYLQQNYETLKFKNSKVLDLGCGAGILGIYAFMNGAYVTFQDYNKEVIEHVTIPNLILNIEEELIATEVERCKFFSGDWASFNHKIPNNSEYDLILTSETIYNENNYEKLVTLFLDRLSTNGIAYVAAKTCYFGVGGGMRQFEKNIKTNENLNCEVCWRNNEGIQREILKITKKS